LILGTKEALERFNREHPELFPDRRDQPRETSPTRGPSETQAPARQDPPPGPSTSAREDRRLEAIDRAIELRDDPDLVALAIYDEDEQPVAAAWRPRYAAPTLTPRSTAPDLPHTLGTVGVTAERLGKSRHALILQNAKRRLELSASLALAATAAGGVCVHAVDRRPRKRTSLTWTRR